MDKLVIFDCDGLTVYSDNLFYPEQSIPNIAKDNSWKVTDILEFEAFIFVEVQ